MNLGIVGYSGRFGSRLVEAAAARDHQVTYRRDAREEHVQAVPHVVIDVSHRSALETGFEYAARYAARYVVGTSGVHEQLLELMQRRSVPPCVVEASNFSPVNFLFRRLSATLSGLLATANRPCEVLITDRHPSTKVDRPSATGKRIERLFADSPGARNIELISVRAGVKVSTHEVLASFEHCETIRLEHNVVDFAGAVSGAFMVLTWLGKNARRKGFVDVDEVFEDLMREESESRGEST